ncbi:MAG: hypothetical protein AAFN70_09815, partial [Planctomycetota bacterium]
MKRVFFTLFLLTFCTVANAHFPWVVINDKGKVEYFFGEGMTDRTYKLPGSIAGAEIMARVDGKYV